MSGYKIEKGIPIPTGKTKTEWPFRQMEIGDSVLIDREEYGRGYAAARSHCRNNEKNFCIKKSEGGYRIWRTN